ncbi:Reverse transcriptase (RNA-dependent DNA polymerase) [Popillia japonica]|uniref:Reverse transcriptase (RNA-dependent DNA polymerase) n=1 Tax=Popillia japonica TaxID=7064 RepID=A0AAW1JEA0_POPJA
MASPTKMEYRMELERLSKDELAYELAILGVTTVTTVEEMRKTLRRMRKLAKHGSFVRPAHPFTVAVDLAAMRKTLRRMRKLAKHGSFVRPAHPFTVAVDLAALTGLSTEIKALLDTFAGSRASTEYKKLEAKLSHATGRLGRVVASTEEEKEQVSRLLVAFSEYSMTLRSKAKHFARSSTLNASTVTALEGMSGPSSSSEAEDSDTDQGAQGRVDARSRESQMKSVPVMRWNLKYSGDNSVLSFNAFIERVEELMNARGVSRDQVFAQALDLFSGRALIWYRANRRLVSCWDELVVALREEFQAPDYDEQLFDEIKDRTSGSVLKDLTRVSVPEGNRIKIMVRNLSPFYQSQLGLVEIKSVEELLSIGRKLEWRKTCAERYVPPPRRQQSMEPDLAYMSSGSSVASVEANSRLCPLDLRWHLWKLTPVRLSNVGIAIRKVFFKLQSGALRNWQSRPVPSAEPKNPVLDKQQVLLDFVLAHAQGDERPYLTVTIFGQQMLGLLDSGASRTILGSQGWKCLQKLGVGLSGDATLIRVADGRTCDCLGSLLVPVRLRDVERLVEILVVPEVTSTLILGADFWTVMGIVPDLRRGEWSFSTEVEVSSVTDGAGILSAIERARLDELVNKLFANIDPQVLGCTELVEHTIETDSAPIKQRYYPISPAMQKIVNQELDKMLAQGVVERSSSPWSSPILLIPKKDNTYRFCVDYRKLNAVTKRDAYPLPYVSHILDKLRDSKYLTTLDIKSAYWEIPMAEASKPYTAFTVPNRGLFQFKRMPFGLHNAPATWQRFIDRVIGADLEPHVFAYLDDIIIVTPTFEKHVFAYLDDIIIVTPTFEKHLRRGFGTSHFFAYLDDIIIVTPTFEKHLEILAEVVGRIHGAGLTLNREKSLFCRAELKYLGYIVNGSGLHVDPEKIKAILDIPIPKTVSEVRRMIGISSWYRRFVRDYGTLVVPLTNLLRKNRVVPFFSLFYEVLKASPDVLFHCGWNAVLRAGARSTRDLGFQAVALPFPVLSEQVRITLSGHTFMQPLSSPLLLTGALPRSDGGPLRLGLWELGRTDFGLLLVIQVCFGWSVKTDAYFILRLYFLFTLAVLRITTHWIRSEFVLVAAYLISGGSTPNGFFYFFENILTLQLEGGPVFFL